MFIYILNKPSYTFIGTYFTVRDEGTSKDEMTDFMDSKLYVYDFLWYDKSKLRIDFYERIGNSKAEHRLQLLQF